MTIAAFIGTDTDRVQAQGWPILGTPQELADIMNGIWNGMPDVSIEAIRHRNDTIEDGLKNFLFAPQLFAKPNGSYSRAALLSSTEALAKGAVGIIATMRPRNISSDIPCLLVNDVSEAIGRLAQFRRHQSRAKFIAVTGSVGKSTTKNMIQLLTSSKGHSNCSIANYNAGLESIHFTLSNLSRDHDYCVAEFSEVGNLEDQVKMYRPHIAVVTNVLWEHIDRVERQGYRGDQAIRRLAYLAAGVARHMEPDGICVLNADEENFDTLLEEIRKSPGIRVFTFGSDPKNDVNVLSVKSDASGCDISISVQGLPHSYRLGLPGKHMAMNSIAAATAAHFAGIPLSSALKLLANIEPDSRRGVYIHIPWSRGQLTIRDETVSSSIPSLRSSFAQLEGEQPAKGGRRIVVLGQINGLGHTTKAAMTALAKEVDLSSIDRIYTIGSDIRILNENIADRNRVAPHFQTLDQLERALREELRAGDIVVFKGTRTPAKISLRRLVNRLTGVAKTTLHPAVNAVPSPNKRIIIAGDTYFGESYQEKRARSAELNYLDAFGYDYSGQKLAPLLQRADFTVVNLECALTESPTSKLEGRKDYILRGKPRETIAALKNLNVGGVLLGNNHSMDYLAGGLRDTLHHITASGIALAGAGSNRQNAQQPILKRFDVDGISFKLAIVSAYEYTDSHEELGFYAGAEKPGVNNMNIDRLGRQIADLRSNGYYVIVSPHWGLNYCLRTYAQSRLARRLVDIGADLVIGHGPHMMNELAQIDGVWVVYSLGNLIFNSEGEYERQNVQPYSLISELELRREGSSIAGHLNLYPIVSCNQMTQFQPTFVDDHQFSIVMQMLQAANYDKVGFLEKMSPRTVDGRHCFTTQVF